MRPVCGRFCCGFGPDADADAKVKVKTEAETDAQKKFTDNFGRWLLNKKPGRRQDSRKAFYNFEGFLKK